MTWKDRLTILREFYVKQVSLKLGRIELDKIVLDNAFGKIDSYPEDDSGIWGSECDCLAVYINGKPYKSIDILEINEELISK